MHFSNSKNVFQIPKISTALDYCNNKTIDLGGGGKAHLFISVTPAVFLKNFLNCSIETFSETFIPCSTIFFFPFRAPLYQASERQFILNHSSMSRVLFSVVVNKTTAPKSLSCFWSGFSIHSSNETSAFSLMSKVIWQTEFGRRIFLLLLCMAQMLHKYYLASPWCILCALCL